MRGSAHSLAAILSVLMASTSVSGSACELCCGLKQAAGQCHTNRARMSFGAGYSKEAAHACVRRAAATSPRTHGMATHCASHEMGTAARAAELTGICHSGMSQPGGTASPCLHRGCTWFLAGKFSPAPAFSELVELARTAVTTSRQEKLQSNVLQFNIGSSPPVALASESLSGVLRI